MHLKRAIQGNSGGIISKAREREIARERERGRKLAPVAISSFLIILFHVAEHYSLDMGVMVIMGIYNLFLQSSCCYYIRWLTRGFPPPPPSLVAEWLMDLTLIWSNLCIICPFGAVFCAHRVIKSQPMFVCIPMDVFALACVCLAWHAWVGGGEFQGLTGWGGGL